MEIICQVCRVVHETSRSRQGPVGIAQVKRFEIRTVAKSSERMANRFLGVPYQRLNPRGLPIANRQVFVGTLIEMPDPTEAEAPRRD